jgi:AAA15 family ATPase/GTPase
MKITEIEIKKFRNLSEISVSFAPGLNAIAGQNGTSKTSLLGLVGHIFTYDKDIKTLSGKNYFTDFSEIFRFAYPDFDRAGEHIWNTKFDTNKDIPAISYDRKEKGKKETIRIRVGKSERGSGKIKLPVIYLGMGRLFPLTLEENIVSNKSVLTEQENKEFVDLHNEILLIVDEQIIPESITSSSKSFYAPKSNMYNHLGNSAGQDNIGQIITALLSFKRLQKELGDNYSGGILLIDELDASLFPAAQMKLVEKLDKKSRELNLQIFFTTHSMEVLVETSKKRDSKVIYLDKNSGKIIPKYNLDIEELRKDLLVLGPDALKEIQRKKFVYCEDGEASDMLKCFLPSDIKKRIDIFPTKLGKDQLKDIAKKKIPDFKKSLIVLDGDTSNGRLNNVICLPGNFGPDRLIYDFLRTCDSAIFEKIKTGYTKQFCFRDVNTLDSSTDDNRTRDKLKRWYKDQRKNWGRSGTNAWKFWVKQNQKEVDKFIEKFKKSI